MLRHCLDMSGGSMCASKGDKAAVPAETLTLVGLDKRHGDGALRTPIEYTSIAAEGC